MLLDVLLALFLTHVGQVVTVRKQPASLRSDPGPHHRNRWPTSPECATDEDLSVGALVELGDSVHGSGFCLFILWKVFAFAFAFVLRQAAIRCWAAVSALTPMAQMKPSSSRPTAVMILRWSLPAAASLE